MDNPLKRRPLSPVEQRAEQILDVVLAFATGDYEHELALTGDDSVFDGLSAGINVLGEELKSYTEALKAQQLYLKSIHQSMGEALFVLDSSLRVKTVNTAAVELIGRSKEELLTMPFSALFTGEEFQRLGLERLVSQSAAFEKQEARMLVHEVQSIPITLSISGLHTDDESSHGLVCIVQDISEQKRAKEALLTARRIAEEANQAKSAFLASTSHELRTPLNAIIGYSQLIMEEISDCFESAMELVPDLQKIELSGQYLLTLINNILDLSKVEAGKMDLLVETFAVNPLLHMIQEISQPLVEKRRNTLILEVSPDVGEMASDATKTQQILFNLLSNATKFSSSSKIYLRANRTQKDGRDWLRFQVQDEGIGMTEEQTQRIFKPFSQAHNAISKEYGGTGLGLALSRRFCELLGGHISVESIHGVGSTFTVALPARAPLQHAAP